MSQFVKLRELINEAKKDPKNNEFFRKVISQAIALDVMNERMMARYFCVSLPTIGRWKEGESAPHPCGRPSVYRIIYQSVCTTIRRRRESYDDYTD